METLPSRSGWRAFSFIGWMSRLWVVLLSCFFFFSSRRRHTRCSRDWSSDVCSSDLLTTRFLGLLRLLGSFWLLGPFWLLGLVHLPALVRLLAALHGDLRHVLLGRFHTLDHGAEVLVAEVAGELAPARAPFAGLAHGEDLVQRLRRGRVRLLCREREQDRDLSIPELLGAEIPHVLCGQLARNAVGIGVELELRPLPLVHDLGGHAASIAVRGALVDLLRELGEFFVAFRIHVLCRRRAGDEADHQGDRGEC